MYLAVAQVRDPGARKADSVIVSCRQIAGLVTDLASASSRNDERLVRARVHHCRARDEHARIESREAKAFKQVMRPVIDRIDHQMLNDLEPFTELNPSAENLARYFYDETNRQLNEMTGGRVAVKDCTIWETDATTATYYE